MDWALAVAGMIGLVTALVHSVLVQRLMVAPLNAVVANQPNISAAIKGLIAPLLQFSGFAWGLGGIALILVALGAAQETRLAIGLFVGALYAFGAVFNFIATKGRHPGWMLMVVAVALIALALGGRG